MGRKSDLRKLCELLDGFSEETILAAVGARLGGRGRTPLVIPPVVVFPGFAPPAPGDNRSGDCGPASTSATKWGDWSQTEDGADRSAREKARKAAAAACGGDCPKDGEDCTYKETSMELLETEEHFPEDGGVVEYRTRARSSGRCQCE